MSTVRRWGGDIKNKMPKFGTRSKEELATCHPLLQELFNEVIKHINCSVLVGRRDEAEQNEAFANKRSKLKYPDSTHNEEPSRGVDVAPWYKKAPHIRWWDTKKFYYFGGIVLGVATEMGINIRWGGDWDQDHDLGDQDFNDLVHFEIKE